MSTELDPIKDSDRRVRNIHRDGFVPFIDGNGRHDGDVLQANPDNHTGSGFHVYRMDPGHTTTQHVHTKGEEFLILEGDLVDHDGYKYGPGDLVWLREGTEHYSYSPNGCLIAVYLPAAEF